jgi:hypothetical protein
LAALFERDATVGKRATEPTGYRSAIMADRQQLHTGLRHHR